MNRWFKFSGAIVNLDQIVIIKIVGRTLEFKISSSDEFEIDWDTEALCEEAYEQIFTYLTEKEK